MIAAETTNRQLCSPDAQVGAAVHRLIERAGGLDTNSLYFSLCNALISPKPAYSQSVTAHDRLHREPRSMPPCGQASRAHRPDPNCTSGRLIQAGYEK